MQSPAIYSGWICSFVWIFRGNISLVILISEVGTNLL